MCEHIFFLPRNLTWQTDFVAVNNNIPQTDNDYCNPFNLGNVKGYLCKSITKFEQNIRYLIQLSRWTEWRNRKGLGIVL